MGVCRHKIPKGILILILALISIAYYASVAQAGILKEKAGCFRYKPYEKYWDCRLPIQDQIKIKKIARKYNLEFDFVMAVIKIESDFNKNARSNTNDTGLMQINDCNKKDLNKVFKRNLNLYSLSDNVNAGCYILSNNIKNYKNKHKALMAYNMGDFGAKRLWRKGIYSSRYSRKIIKEYRGEKQYDRN